MLHPAPRAGGFAGEGIKTIIPASARAKLAARLVAAQQPAEILELLEAHIAEHHPPACNVTIKELGFKGNAFVTARGSPVMTAAAKVGMPLHAAGRSAGRLLWTAKWTLLLQAGTTWGLVV